MSTILILVIILVVLVIIDLCRKAIRIKQKEALKRSENESTEKLIKQTKSSLSNIEEVKDEYPLLKDGYLLFYFEGIDMIDVNNLSMFLKYYGIKYTDEQVFQKVNYDDVIFTVLPDNKAQVFESQKEGSIKSLVVVMNFKKLADMQYDVKTCYELMMDVLEAMNKSFHGTIMNENRIRLTKRDKQNYLDAIL
ncbi:cell division protein ZipA C-terminal FtsZ-binding domain-containing protein [Francisella adeliensis]|uniref:Cell division protein ZipA n=1 Tax=Francisella adeliensis TaxID=2007306 RepID=A0A2Z4XZU8_9GAMM|nr:cell division protein ZipA C-terminal FtsZ-binding domain-containing protein [Francisella adeliensis]AXA34411.1 hypothetical protein CDH04_08385 [Francisella adeliensis]MBK2086503.1 hypothetical protein [Francisella adeliensis]MBK2096131.1 hypothetical protein [Francisella adeliensis]QIW12657.1 hypothetical protein FZC43_08390 [Francisella adeliensis]QIW14532.1 hypothetical protein FZC44_08385 [Francisella adeliensis]